MIRKFALSFTQFLIIHVGCLIFGVVAVAIADYIGVPSVERWWLVPSIGASTYLLARSAVLLWAIVRNWPMATQAELERGFRQQRAGLSWSRKFCCMAVYWFIFNFVAKDAMSADPVWSSSKLNFHAKGPLLVSPLTMSVIFTFAFAGNGLLSPSP